MRNVKMVIAVVIGIGFTAGLCAQTIVGSAHDFSAEAWNGTGEVCVVCHTPHNANVNVNNAPLWDHSTTQSTFDLYSSPTLDGTTAQPDGATKLCLSCHDGTVALDNFGGTTTGSQFISGDANVGTSLSDDHPVSITYDAGSDDELHDVTDPLSIGGTVDDLLFDGKVECASCHDVHNTGNHGSLLRMANDGSQLCLSCHAK